MTFLLLAAAACAALGLVLGMLHSRSRSGEPVLVRRVADLLPGIECGQCGYPGCAPYAAAIVRGEAPTTLCPPGGQDLVRELSALLNLAHENARPCAGPVAFSQVAFVDEGSCIGCGLCAQACPFDAIAGAPQAMHTIVAEHCTGCELCVAPCPVDCISMRRLAETQAVLRAGT